MFITFVKGWFSDIYYIHCRLIGFELIFHTQNENIHVYVYVAFSKARYLLYKCK